MRTRTLFFSELLEKTNAVEDLSLSDGLSARVAVSQVKKFLAGPEHRIRLHDLLVSETEQAFRAIYGTRFNLNDAPFTQQKLVDRMKAYERSIEVLLPVCACGGYWSESAQFNSFTQPVQRIGTPPEHRNGLSVRGDLRRYPALLLMYAAGIAAIASENYGFVAALLTADVRPEKHQPSGPMIVVLNAVSAGDWQNAIPEQKGRHTALSLHLTGVLREPLRDYLPDDASYQPAFDWFEYLAALVYCNLTNTHEEIERLRTSGADFEPWGPLGCFFWRRYSDESSILEETALKKGQKMPTKVAAVLDAGLFGTGAPSNFERFREVKERFDRFVATCRRGRGIYF